MRLKELRKQKKLRQCDVAEVINCSQAVYSRYENGERAPSMDTLKTLADFYGVTIDYLSGHDDLHHTAGEEPGSGIKRGYQYTPEDVHVTGNFGQGKSKLAAESAKAFQQLDPNQLDVSSEEADQARLVLLNKLQGMSLEQLARIEKYADLLKMQEDMEKEAKK